MTENGFIKDLGQSGANPITFHKFPYEYTKGKRWYEVVGFNVFPDQNKRYRDFYELLEEINLDKEHFAYPIKLRRYHTDIEPTKENTAKYYSFAGVLKFLDKMTLSRDARIFIKFEVFYPNRKSEIPTIRIHLFEIDESGGIELNSVMDSQLIDNVIVDSVERFVEFARVHYKNHKMFTDQRIQNIRDAGIPFMEIVELMNLPISRVEWSAHKPVTEKLQYLIPLYRGQFSQSVG